MICLKCNQEFFIFNNLEVHWEKEHQETEGRDIYCKIVYEGTKYYVGKK